MSRKAKRTKSASPSDEWKTQVPEPQGYKPEVMFDLDGTLAQSVWPLSTIGEPIQETVALLRGFVREGHPCSIWTSRPEDHKSDIWDWLYYTGLKDLIYRVVCDKPIYALNVDDRSWCPPWLTTPPSKTKS